MLSFSFLLLGVIYLLKYFQIISVTFNEILSIIFVFYGILTVYTTLGEGRRFLAILAAITFFIGVILYITCNFDILNTQRIIYPSILFILGGCFVILFFDNPKEKIFLISGMILWAISIFIIFSFKNIIAYLLLNYLWNILLSFYPFFLMIIGISFLARRYK